MSEQGAILESISAELVKNIDTVKDKQEQIILEIKALEEQKKVILDMINSLRNELTGIEAKLDDKYQKQLICQQIVTQSHTGLEKLIENMKVLTQLTLKESQQIIELE